MAKNKAELPRQYWDACVFSEYLEDSPQHAPLVEGWLELCKSGEVRIFSSWLSVAEVAYVARELKKGLSVEEEKKIDALWEPPSKVDLIEFHPGLARDARDIIRENVRQGRTGLKAADAVHLATALRRDVQVFFTYDDGLLGLDKYSIVPFAICQPTDPPQPPKDDEAKPAEPKLFKDDP